jgi:hypothetical protein
LTKSTNASILGVSVSTKFNNFGAIKSIGTFPNPSEFASISTTHGPPTSREPTNKRKKKRYQEGFQRRMGCPISLG